MEEEDRTSQSIMEHRSRILRKMNIAAAARFVASRRLESRSRSINLMLALLGAAVIVISILPILLRIDERGERVLVVASVCAAILVLVLSLYQYSSRDDVNSENCLQNGIEISSIRKRFEIADLQTHYDLKPFVEEYIFAIKKCGIRHEEVDFTKAKLLTNNYEGSALRRPLDQAWACLKQLPALTYVSFAILLAVIVVTVSVVS